MGLVTSVLPMAAGTLARKTTAVAAESGICATGSRKPKKMPMAMPSATLRREKCQSLRCPSQGASQRVARCLASCSRVGMNRRKYEKNFTVGPDFRNQEKRLIFVTTGIWKLQ